MITMTKEFHFSAAHRIEGHPKCGRLHGHNYKVVVTLGRPKGGLDAMGFIVDFGELKKVMAVLLNEIDHTYLVSQENVKAECVYLAAADEANLMDDITMLPILQTSAEHLAEYFHFWIQTTLNASGHQDIAVMEVEVWETETAYASS